MKKKVIRKIAMIATVLMVVLTVIYIAYAISPKEGAIDTVYSAFLYEGEPNEWYYPQELGITKILDYGAGEKATWLHVVVPHELDPGDLQIERPIFKWQVNGKFYQISELWVTPGVPGPTNIQPMSLAGLSGGWLLTVILFWKSRRLQQ